MDRSCPYCSKRIFQVNVRRVYLIHRDVDPEDIACVREEVEEARCSSCGMALPSSYWDDVRPRPEEKIATCSGAY